MKLTFANTPDGYKVARLFLAVNHIWQNFDRYVWAAPAHRAEFNYEDESVHIFSYFNSGTNYRTTTWHDKNYGSWGAMVDAITRAGQRVVSIAEFGGPDSMNIVGPDNFYFVDLDHRLMHGQDQDGNHSFAVSSAAYVGELLDRQLKPWAVHPEEPRHKLKPITRAFIGEIIRQGYRSKDLNNWAAPGVNIGQLH
ncbi:hypothetical protein [Mesorhizobium sp.]|uniref:hypothetical protein n=1 Tax=Mesorhizobium sp. TaxID=1871066 RepID=UPI000FE72213|nr:hypothetical protein [Mesorhizobium sp.]RWD31157.1 MAG: hypothetical protein EOS33_14645 [Mesorhizobium sp.]